MTDLDEKSELMDMLHALYKIGLGFYLLQGEDLSMWKDKYADTFIVPEGLDDEENMIKIRYLEERKKEIMEEIKQQRVNENCENFEAQL